VDGAEVDLELTRQTLVLRVALVKRWKLSLALKPPLLALDKIVLCNLGETEAELRRHIREIPQQIAQLLGEPLLKEHMRFAVTEELFVLCQQFPGLACQT
jgi:hypothetical protein